MGKRGPKRESTKSLKLRGSWKGKERVDVEVDPCLPDCPEELEGNAREYWFRIVPKMANMGILADIDAESIADLCNVYAEKKKLRPQAVFPLIKHEKKLKDGTVKVTFEPNQMYSAYWKMVDRFRKLRSDFFMSPADRAGMGGVQQKQKDDKKAKFFEKYKA
jgi:P27 family predicted phage terminase small subunit